MSWRNDNASAQAGMWLCDFVRDAEGSSVCANVVDAWGTHHPGVVEGLHAEGSLILNETGTRYTLSQSGRDLSTGHRRNLDAIYERNRLQDRMKAAKRATDA